MKTTLLLLALLLPLCATQSAQAKKDAPSRAATKDCKWEKVEDAKLGLAAWVERCDYGFRRIDLYAEGNALMERFSDGGKPDAVIETFELKPDEKIEDGVRRIFTEHTDKALAKRCVLKPYKGIDEKVPPGVKRYTFVPNAQYQKEVDKTSSPDEVGDPACGDWGDAPDGIQYFETQPGNNAHRVMFVRVGQDEPLFDENTLRLLPAAAEEVPQNY